MENNEISMDMDVKLDIHGKRPESLKFKAWSKCRVTIQAIKCLPSFLRITLSRCVAQERAEQQSQNDQMCNVSLAAEEAEPPFCVSINVPGVSVSQTESRTKSYSYGLFWKQHRRDCFIYFASETESSCRRHMKWIKKSIKNLELHRQIFLQQRRNSRGSLRTVALKATQEQFNRTTQQSPNGKGKKSTAPNLLGPLPNTPFSGVDADSSNVSTGLGRVSEIYEEIGDYDAQHAPPHLSRRLSRTSIASGIYEEMKPVSAANFNAIVEELSEKYVDKNSLPPPLPPPLPAHRKRLNTFGAEVGEIMRSNTDPESDMAKKKKCKNIIDSIFGGVGRSKRAASVSESAACSIDELLTHDIELSGNAAAAETPTAACSRISIRAQQQKQQRQQRKLCADSKRNSFSSPDLSKINFLDTFDEERIVALLNNSFTDNAYLSESNGSLDENSMRRIVEGATADAALQQKETPPSALSPLDDSLNVSEQLPLNFNFSACNTSTINLVGASGAVPTMLQTAQRKSSQKLLSGEDFSGYCVMAPLQQAKEQTTTLQQSLDASQTCSVTNAMQRNVQKRPEAAAVANSVVASANETSLEESGIYEVMMCGENTSGNNNIAAIVLYENMAAIKASALELAGEPTPPPAPPARKMSTSTPTGGNGAADEVEDFYQTPRKSIISVDEKMPSYYSNECNVVSRIRCNSQQQTRSGQATPSTTMTTTATTPISATIAFRHLNGKLRSAERSKENYISPSHKIQEQQSTANAAVMMRSPTTESGKCKANKVQRKTAATVAHAISERIHSVSQTCSKKMQRLDNTAKSPNVLLKQQQQQQQKQQQQQQQQQELAQLDLLKKIDFTFDDIGAQSSQQSAAAVVAGAEDTATLEIKCCTSCVTPKLHNYAQMMEGTDTTTLTAATTTPMPTATAATTTPITTAITTPSSLHMLQHSQQANTQQLQRTTTVAESTFKKFASLQRFKKIDFSPLKLKINNVLQRNQQLS